MSPPLLCHLGWRRIATRDDPSAVTASMKRVIIPMRAACVAIRPVPARAAAGYAPLPFRRVRGSEPTPPSARATTSGDGFMTFSGCSAGPSDAAGARVGRESSSRCSALPTGFGPPSPHSGASWVQVTMESRSSRSCSLTSHERQGTRPSSQLVPARHQARTLEAVAPRTSVVRAASTIFRSWRRRQNALPRAALRAHEGTLRKGG